MGNQPAVPVTVTGMYKDPPPAYTDVNENPPAYDDVCSSSFYSANIPPCNDSTPPTVAVAPLSTGTAVPIVTQSSPPASQQICNSQVERCPEAQRENPSNYRNNAIVAVIFCFPVGIVALIYSFKVDRELKACHYEEATKSSKYANELSQFSNGYGFCFCCIIVPVISGVAAIVAAISYLSME
ncbi:uncharacterized protein [Dysidea avara]|uniref:uncharacterized protein isoform X1 n=1 Tax=Dysidea avara TaxID=196820 RepID=UPI0033251BAD